MKYELNLDIETENIKFLDKIFYQAEYDEIWGEYESYNCYLIIELKCFISTSFLKEKSDCDTKIA